MANFKGNLPPRGFPSNSETGHANNGIFQNSRHDFGERWATLLLGKYGLEIHAAFRRSFRFQTKYGHSSMVIDI